MFVIFLITVILATILYCIIEDWFKDWIHDLRMDPSRLPNRRSSKKNLRGINNSDISMDDKIDLSAGLSEVYEIPSDESLGDEEKIKNHEETEEKNNSNVFDLTTDSDSNISDDFTQSSCTSYAAKMSMFSWPKQETNTNSKSKRRNQIASASNASISEAESIQSKQKRFRKSKDTKIKHYEHSDSLNIEGQNENKDIPSEPTVQHEITIAGTKVKLPVKPYPCQTAVINMLIQGCAKEQNCLLESPTGSGKTLALLCGALAWQDSYSEQIKKKQWKMAEDYFNCHGDGSCSVPDGATGCCTIDPTSFDAFKVPEYSSNVDADDFDDMDDKVTEGKRLQVPKIYYGTRTHKQLAQVVKELSRTHYKNKRMSILSSREHTCIQDTTKNKTELCHDLLDWKNKSKCPYYNEKNKKELASFEQLKNYGMSLPFDIEELVDLGKQAGICPYFAARNLAEHAEIVFCPYNYIIDPDIRESMKINVKNQVIILDEGHNIEDVCRGAGSASFREDDLLAAVTECETLAIRLKEGDRYTYEIIARYVDDLVKLIKSITLESRGNHDDLSSPYWTGSELLQLLEVHGIGGSKCTSALHAAQTAIQDFNNAKEDSRAGMFAEKKPNDTISRSTKIVLQQLTFGLNKIVTEGCEDDYRAFINESFVQNVRKTRTDDVWISTQRSGKHLRTLKLICMNPAVIFAPLARDARSIILASGTLTPTVSFQSELGTKFPHVLSANHVIDSNQVHVRCVSKGPTGVLLKATYQNVNNWNFQDELGRLILNVCRSVPHGILCFFSSYQMMNTQIKRWESSDTWISIQKYKRVFIEPRSTNDLADTMTEYRETIKETSDESSSLSGAILFAVYRGKVAEGIDFSDNEARCVLTIGIPYPVRKDPEVDMKCAYNDKNVSKGLLNGNEWYTIQAFRALNQAVGRCIRHKNDWGALLLVDERFRNQSNINNLPKWIKTRLRNSSVDDLTEELENFVMTKKGKKSTQ
ncbi:hypothetical protein KPH14_011080 [Odynerus spinipes]|uniref:DNA 5'-3' helicase n=1 Tax=Odynerus spinipes TaxID=1348599 RepID=A0AAD9VMC8_9HYME|nr:hypothetical protein KPH14_011080 [Odynerus spinipes]